MFLDQDLTALNGVLLMGRGQKVTPTLIARLESFRQTQGLVEPLRVQVTSAGLILTPRRLVV
jgi:hypothetical protein